MKSNFTHKTVVQQLKIPFFGKILVPCCSPTLACYVLCNLFSLFLYV